MPRITKAIRAQIHATIIAYAEKAAEHNETIREALPELRRLKPTHLLRTNSKTEKTAGAAAEFLIGILTLAPGDISGVNLCPFMGACFFVCNQWWSGMQIQAVSRNRKLYDTLFLLAAPALFRDQLRDDIELLVKRCRNLGVQPLVRLNGASDLGWAALIREYPDVVFYDYTKAERRFRDYLAGKLPPNYNLVFSASEKSDDATLREFLDAGGNVVVVLAIDYYPAAKRIGRIPREFKLDGATYPTFDADEHDVRLPSVDGRGRVGVLRMKGAANETKARGLASGFSRVA